MTIFDKNALFNSLTQHIKDKWYAKASKKNPEFAKAISEITLSDISISEPPTIRRGYVEGNSTGVGKSQQGDTTYTRTVSISFSTEEYFFAEKQDAALANYALSVLGAHSSCHTPAEAEYLASNYGRTQCRNNLHDLNFSMSEYRLNRYKLIYTDEPFRPPVYSVYANITNTKGKKEKVYVGHYYIRDDEEYVDWSISTPLTDKAKLIIGSVITAAIIVAAILLFAL